MKPSWPEYVYASPWPWRLIFWGLPLGCSLAVGIGSGHTGFLSVLPYTLLGAFIGFMPAVFFIETTLRTIGDANGPFRVGDMARILVKPHRNRVARVCDVWPEQQCAQLEIGQKTRRFGEDIYSWYQLAREADTEPTIAAADPRADGG